MSEEGHLQLLIQNGFVGFTPNFWRDEQQRSSTPVTIRQLPWIIKVKHERSEAENRHFRCSVICNSGSKDKRWSCAANVILQVLVQNELLVKSEWKQHTFSSRENSCGFKCFIPTTMLSQHVAQFGQPATNTLLVKADIKIEAPYVPKWVSLRLSGIGASLADRMMYLLSSEKDANVHFLVGTGNNKEEFAAHKGILSTLSDVFDRMFNFDSNNGNSNKLIEVTDVEPEAFRVMLNFIYTTNLGGLNQQNVFDVLHAAKKYDITDLINACADCPKLDVNNVLYSLGKALFYNVKSLIDRCWKFIEQNAYAVLLESDKIVEIDQELLRDLFARDRLVLRNGEIDIWNAALRWADSQCHKRNIEATGDNRRNILGPALFNIRLPLIPKDQFVSIIVPTKMLTEKEMLSVLFYHVHSRNVVPSEYPLAFSSKFRA